MTILSCERQIDLDLDLDLDSRSRSLFCSPSSSHTKSNRPTGSKIALILAVSTPMFALISTLSKQTSKQNKRKQAHGELKQLSSIADKIAIDIRPMSTNTLLCRP